jgi:hypothetical protein
MKAIEFGAGLLVALSCSFYERGFPPLAAAHVLPGYSLETRSSR